MGEWFKTWFDTTYYDILYDDRDELEAEEFIQNLLRYLNLDQRAFVLDIGCGTGRHALALAENGFDVTGIDLSLNRIEKALVYQNEHLNFYQHDMRHLFRINYYDVVFNLFTSFGYFESPNDDQKAALSMALNVKNGGIFVLDYLNAHYVIDGLIHEEHITKQNIHFDITKKLVNNRVIKQIAVCDHDSCQMFEESVRLYSLNEIELLFAPCRLKLTQVFGNHQLEPYDPMKSERMICIFKKDIIDL